MNLNLSDIQIQAPLYDQGRVEKSSLKYSITIYYVKDST